MTCVPQEELSFADAELAALQEQVDDYSKQLEKALDDNEQLATSSSTRIRELERRNDDTQEVLQEEIDRLNDLLGDSQREIVRLKQDNKRKLHSNVLYLCFSMLC